MTEELFVGISKDNFGEFKGWYKDKDRTILHRMNGPAKEYVNGIQVWYFDGKIHRKFGPARICSSIPNRYTWAKNGLRHRFDGVACTDSNEPNPRYDYFWISGVEKTREEFKECISAMMEKAANLPTISVLIRRFSDFSIKDFLEFGFHSQEVSENEELFITKDLIPIKILLLKDTSTSKKTILRVHPDVDTIREGLEWSFSQKSNEYNPEIQT